MYFITSRTVIVTILLFLQILKTRILWEQNISICFLHIVWWLIIKISLFYKIKHFEVLKMTFTLYLPIFFLNLYFFRIESFFFIQNANIFQLYYSNTYFRLFDKFLEKISFLQLEYFVLFYCLYFKMLFLF